jgi:hypothetical protein
MKSLLLPFAVIAVIGWTSAGYGQQPSPPGWPPQTCSQTLAACMEQCPRGSPNRGCRCQDRHSDCMATGIGRIPGRERRCPGRGNSFTIDSPKLPLPALAIWARAYIPGMTTRA